MATTDSSNLEPAIAPIARLERGRFVVLIPVFNDWSSARLLLRDLDGVLAAAKLRASIVLVDDGSDAADTESWSTTTYVAIDHVDVLTLRRNLGHQRAITIGLATIAASVTCEAVVVMDGDGEDAPADVARLIERYEAEGRSKIVFARRGRRSEGYVFRFFYLINWVLYRIATGQEIRVGNFSLVPSSLLRRLVVVSEIWNHYAAGVLRSRLPRVEIVTHRAKRLAGEPKMSFVALVMHGLSAISVYADIVGSRLLIASLAFIALVAMLIGVVVAIKFATTLAIPGWATSAVGSLLVLLVQGVFLSTFFVFIVLHTRQSFSFLPSRDYVHYVLSFESVFRRVSESDSGFGPARP